MFARLYLRLADCQHKTLLRRRSTLESGFTAPQEECIRCKKCHMVWPRRSNGASQQRNGRRAHYIGEVLLPAQVPRPCLDSLVIDGGDEGAAS